MNNQRWNNGRGSYRPAGETINPLRYEVAKIDDDTTARAFIKRHHYAGTYPPAVWRFGLYDRNELAGVAVFSVPQHPGVITSALPVRDWRDGIELGRFVLLDQVPGNGETFFLRQCFAELARIGLAGVVSFSDPVARSTAAGELIFRGHYGTIYQAFNGRYIGRGSPATLHLLPDGQVFPRRTIQKIKADDKAGGAIARLVRAGAAAPYPGEDLRAWCDLWIPRLTRRLRHPGNFKYAWALRSRSLRQHLDNIAESYPKPPAAA